MTVMYVVLALVGVAIAVLSILGEWTWALAIGVAALLGWGLLTPTRRTYTIFAIAFFVPVTVTYPFIHHDSLTVIAVLAAIGLGAPAGRTATGLERPRPGGGDGGAGRDRGGGVVRVAGGQTAGRIGRSMGVLRRAGLAHRGVRPPGPGRDAAPGHRLLVDRRRGGRDRRRAAVDSALAGPGRPRHRPRLPVLSEPAAFGRRHGPPPRVRHIRHGHGPDRVGAAVPRCGTPMSRT